LKSHKQNTKFIKLNTICKAAQPDISRQFVVVAPSEKVVVKYVAKNIIAIIAVGSKANINPNKTHSKKGRRNVKRKSHRQHSQHAKRQTLVGAPGLVIKQPGQQKSHGSSRHSHGIADLNSTTAASKKTQGSSSQQTQHNGPAK
jgi:hypothetical protein